MAVRVPAPEREKSPRTAGIEMPPDRSRNRHRSRRSKRKSARKPGINPALPQSLRGRPIRGPTERAMSDHDHNHNDDERGLSRRKVLECMTWAGTGVLWTVTGGV